MTILQKMVLKDHLLPFILGFSVVVFLLSMDFLFDYLDLILGKGIPFLIVLELFLFGLGWMIALAVPCAVLVATLMAFGRLSHDNEVTAMRAAGVNPVNVIVPPFLASLILAVLLVLFNNYVLPETNHAFANLLLDIGRKRPVAKLQEGVFMNEFEGYSMLVGKVNDRTNDLSGITIYQFNPDGRVPTTIVAKKGKVFYSPNGDVITLRLEHGEIHDVPDTSEQTRYRRLFFQVHTINMKNAGALLQRSDREVRGDREMSATMMLKLAATLKNQRADAIARLDGKLSPFSKEYRDYLVPDGHDPSYTLKGWFKESIRSLMKVLRGKQLVPAPPEASRSRYLEQDVRITRIEVESLEKRIGSLFVEIQKKISIPFACVVFVLVGAPLGMRVRKGGIAIAFLSLVFFLFYYICLVGGEQLADRRLVPPVIAMWVANIVLGVVGVVFTLKSCDLRIFQRRRKSRNSPRENS
ncbi:MAG: LptF/LptG family permease [Candidatus Eisenbacteria bacterium]|nr:LptF/LptG family permease [Candidatus Eisenbacteria bacterium]